MNTNGNNCMNNSNNVKLILINYFIKIRIRIIRSKMIICRAKRSRLHTIMYLQLTLWYV